jgi:hypothetical protein
MCLVAGMLPISNQGSMNPSLGSQTYSQQMLLSNPAGSGSGVTSSGLASAFGGSGARKLLGPGAGRRRVGPGTRAACGPGDGRQRVGLLLPAALAATAMQLWHTPGSRLHQCCMHRMLTTDLSAACARMRWRRWLRGGRWRSCCGGSSSGSVRQQWPALHNAKRLLHVDGQLPPQQLHHHVPGWQQWPERGGQLSA